MKYSFHRKNLFPVLGAALALAVVLLYLPTFNFELILLDDKPSIAQNDLVRNGLTTQGIKDSFAKVNRYSWTPLVWLSFMADIELFGMDAGAMHRTNVILFAVNALLLFAFLHRATGSPWKSFFAALLWALHPMRVESVAWVTERKDLLSGAFFLLTLLAWGEYAKSREFKWYLAALSAMFLGLASKPILVVTPVILLLIDFWPLERHSRGEELKKILVEKTPFFAFAAFFAVFSMFIGEKSILDAETVGFPERLMDMATSYVFYLYETFWPFNLAMMDRATAPHFRGIAALGAALLIFALTFLAVGARKRAPAVTAGWLWYLAALFPISGIVPTVFYFVADHFTYLPHMGIAIAAVWGGAALAEGKETLQKAMLALLCLCLLAQTAISAYLIPRWKDSFTLFSYFFEKTGSSETERRLAKNFIEQRDYETALTILDRAIRQNPNDFMLYQSKGQTLALLGRNEEAAAAFDAASELNTNFSGEMLKIGEVAFNGGDYEIARRHALSALDMDKGYAPAIVLLGRVALKTGNREGAFEYFRKALEINGRDERMLKFIGLFLAQNKEAGGAAEYFEKALALAPEDPGNNYNLALALLESGQTGRAAVYFKKTIELDPNGLDARFNLARLLESSGRAGEAIRQYEEILLIVPGDAGATGALAKLRGAK
ncbi:tetratricopeptide repeat protein [bacterium]|nr:MAG: tetratricopeptide repeat protein [bacterium]